MNFEKVYSNNNNLIKELLILKPKINSDERGYFFESWNQKEFNEILGKEISFVQDNHSCSFIGVLRGLHFQISPKSQGKLVRCTKGSIFDVAVDIRKNSSTFSEWIGIELNEENKYQLWIPEGFAHGFLTLTDIAEVQYKTSNFYSKRDERSIRWNDPKLRIEWPLLKLNGQQVSLSNKDLEAPYLSQYKHFDYF